MSKLAPEAAAQAVSKLSLMAFFPSDSDARSALIWALMQLAETQEQLEWLVERALKLYSRWPGVGELRALYCSRFKPRDGVEAYSEIYQRGFPHESPEPAPPPPRVTITTADREFEREIREAAERKRLPGGRRKMQ